MNPRYFKSQSAWRQWLQRHHGQTEGLWVGMYKISTGIPSITYPQALDEALCFGWIDGIRKKVDALSYATRFTPRRKKSQWSEVNTKRVRELIRMGRMRPQGLKAFKARDREKTNRLLHERRDAKLDAAHEAKFRACKKAWQYFQSKPPSYQRLSIAWVMIAKKEQTRLNRLATLIEYSGRQQVIPPFAAVSTSR